MLEKTIELKPYPLSSSTAFEEIIELHRKTFSTSLTGQLGSRFIRMYYSYVWKSPSGRIYVWEESGHAVGFITGTIIGKAIWDLPFYTSAFWYLILSFFSRPLVSILAMQYLIRLCLFRGNGKAAEVLSLVVADAYRRKGIGDALLRKFERSAEAMQRSHINIISDSNYPFGNRFYEARGYRLVKRFKIFNTLNKWYQKSCKERLQVELSSN